MRYEFHGAGDINYNPQQLAGFNLGESLLYALIAICWRAGAGLRVQLPSAGQGRHALMVDALVMLARPKRATRTTLRAGAAADRTPSAGTTWCWRCCAWRSWRSSSGCTAATASSCARASGCAAAPAAGGLAGPAGLLSRPGKTHRAQSGAQFARAGAGRHQPEHGLARQRRPRPCRPRPTGWSKWSRCWTRAS